MLKFYGNAELFSKEGVRFEALGLNPTSYLTLQALINLYPR
jgi:hypothetical protein